MPVRNSAMAAGGPPPEPMCSILERRGGAPRAAGTGDLARAAAAAGGGLLPAGMGNKLGAGATQMAGALPVSRRSAARRGVGIG